MNNESMSISTQKTMLKDSTTYYPTNVPQKGEILFEEENILQAWYIVQRPQHQIITAC
ncbi:MAG: hypothetical protein K1W08_13745 [Lachnospiraceae bacterium]|mgnify:CR=1 FL=1